MALYFSYKQGNWSATGAFYEFWSNGFEDDVWDINTTCTQTWSDDAGGHGVVCLGYN
jgi:hypothetical protein